MTASASMFEKAAAAMDTVPPGGQPPTVEGATTPPAGDGKPKGAMAGRLGGAWPWLDEHFKDEQGNKIAVLRVLTSHQEKYENPGHLADRVAFILHVDDKVDGERTIEQYDFVSCPIGTNRDMTFKPDNVEYHGRLQRFQTRDKSKELLSGFLVLNHERFRVTVNANPDKTPEAPTQPDYYLMWNRAEPIELNGKFGGRVSFKKAPAAPLVVTEVATIQTFEGAPTDEKGVAVY